MELQSFGNTGVTILDNAFIDHYIAEANGEYVKVYLYLMRAAQGRLDVTVTAIADVLDHTEKDILRALRYWQKAGLIRMVESKGQVDSIQLLPPAASAAVSANVSSAEPQPVSAAQTAQTEEIAVQHTPAASAASAAPAAVSANAVPEKKAIPASRRRKISAGEEFKQLLFVAEQYFNRPLTPAEINDLMYFYDTLQFSGDLIECLLECCLDKGDRGPGYMEKVAQSWYQKGITTPEEAKKENKRHNENYYVILRALGISDHRPIDKEIEIMDHWMDDFGFSTEVIREACERTIMRIHKPEFSYVETILDSWHKNGVKEPSDIKALDEAHSQSTAAAAARTAAAASDKKPVRSSGSRFNNFDQRSFDWNALAEQELVKHTDGEN